jgi:hypothetical protein
MDRAAFVDDVFERWLPGAMFPSELVWLERAIRRTGVDVVIECGRQDGVSTWTLASALQGSGVHIESIDFDDDAARLARARQLLEGLDATCVSGDIHAEVPRLLDVHRNRRVAVVQDGPKGWEGMATLLAAAHRPQVHLVAQHNLHLGHVSRTAFEMVALRPAFQEVAAAGDEELAGLRAREVEELARRAPNRPIDHTSLGVIELDPPARAHLEAAVRVLRRRMAPWDPITFLRHWDAGDLGHGSKVRARQRYTPARFKRR